MMKSYDYDGRLYDVEFNFPTERQVRTQQTASRKKLIEASHFEEGSAERMALYAEATDLRREMNDSCIILVNGSDPLDMPSRDYQKVCEDILGNG